MNVSTSSVQRKGQDTFGSLHLVESVEHHHNVCLSYSGWNRSRGSESASTWLSRSFCTTTQRIQLETGFVDEHV